MLNPLVPSLAMDASSVLSIHRIYIYISLAFWGAVNRALPL